MIKEELRVSIITPTNNKQYLGELYRSLKAQTMSAWEWVLLVNGELKKEDLHYDDERVRIYEAPEELKTIGSLKKHACSKARADILVEVDHDDLLLPKALELIYESFNDENVGFVYSDDAQKGNQKPYSEHYGWEHRLIEHEGEQLIAHRTFPPTPASLSFIWFAPDHVRAWRKTVYDSIGGHCETLEVCDDQDLMARLYFVTQFKKIHDVLYIYRVHGENAWLKKNSLIQETTVKLYHEYIERLAMRWADNNGLMKIDLCGGINKKEGYLSLDKEGGDIPWDADNGLPFSDSTVGVIRAYDSLEHLKDKQQTMKEIHRVLAPGGVLLSMTPSTDGRGAFQDPTHVSYWNQNSFWYYTRPETGRYIKNEDCYFAELCLMTFYPSEWHEKHDIPYVKADLSCLKEGAYQPNPRMGS